MGFILRWFFAFALLSVTFNPTDYNYICWASTHLQNDLPMTVLLGLAFVIGYIIYLRATLRSIGWIGMTLILALTAAALWVLYDRGVLSLENRAINIWLSLIALSLVLGIGLS